MINEDRTFLQHCLGKAFYIKPLHTFENVVLE